MKIKSALSGLLFAGMLASGAAHATLFDRGSGLIYDDVLNITWLQDANYAKTSGYDFDGRMTWSQAVAWADSLVYHDSVRNITYADWRLPTAKPVNGVSFNFDFSVWGDTDWSYNLKSPASELSYMYYVNLGLFGFYSETTGWQDADGNFGVLGSGFSQMYNGQADIGLFKNIQNDGYVTGLNFGSSIVMFNAAMGAQVLQSLLDANNFRAWAVRDGDVGAASSVPEPCSLSIMALALVGLIVSRKNRPKPN